MLIHSPTNENIQKARNILKKGGVIVYPTDTLYGLGADIFNLNALKKVRRIKKRDIKKPIPVMVSCFNDIKKIAKVNEKQEKLIKSILPGPFTLLLKRKKIISDIITAETDKIGIRMPDSDICQKLSKNMPITTTSANISTFKPILEINRLAQEIKEKVDFILKGKNLSGQPSIIIDLSKEPFTFFRY
jgi:L-threonylcarbamoyladenylate synthase